MTNDRRYGAFLVIALFMLLGFVLLSPAGMTLTAREKLGAQGAVNAPVAAADRMAAPVKGVYAKSALPAFPIDINTAPIDSLTLLPGVGEKLAKRIIDMRVSSGGFKNGGDLIEVKGIGRKKLEKILPLVTAG